MKPQPKIAAVLVCSCLAFVALQSPLRAQSLLASADMTSQALNNGTFDYTIHLHNDSSSSESINTFWFAWVPDYYGYDLMSSSPTVTQSPAGWNPYVINNSYYYPDGFSIEFANNGGLSLGPGQTFTFAFNSADSPATLGQTSPFFAVPTLTSFAYNSGPGYDPGAEFVVSITPAPEPSTIAMIAVPLLYQLLRQRHKHYVV